MAPSYQWAKVEAAKKNHERRRLERRMKNNLYYVLWHERLGKYWGHTGQRMGWTDVPKLYREQGHALNAYRASVDLFPLQTGKKPEPDQVTLIPIHLTAVGTQEKPQPLSNFYEVTEREWSSILNPEEKMVYYSVIRKAKS